MDHVTSDAGDVGGNPFMLPKVNHGKRARRNTDGAWETPVDGEVLRASGMQTVATYFGRSKGTVAQWVV